jgi:hypothetical protein
MTEAILMSEINDVEQLLKEAVLLHLSEEELGAYHDNTIHEADRSRMKAHLVRCLICSRKLEMMQDVLQSQGESIDDRDIARVKDLLDSQRVVATVVSSIVLAFNVWVKKRSIQPGLRAKFSTAVIEDGQIDDGSVRWRYVEKESGERVVRFGSHCMELEGLKILVKAGQLSKTVVLKSVTQDQVGAEVTFTAQESEKIPAEALLSIDILTKDRDQPEA